MQDQIPKLLIVDNDAGSAGAIKRSLEPLAINISIANSVQHAIVHLSRQPFFLILIGEQIQRDHNSDLESLVLKNNNSAQAPMIFITTADRDYSLLTKDYSSEVVDYIYKPIDYLLLVNKVNVFRQFWQRRLELEYIALHDALTGLANRRLFLTSLGKSIERAKRAGTHVAIFLIDLDKFKMVNDTLGHAAGDELLVKVAERLMLAVRSSDLVARLGGDEFAIVAEDIKADVLAAVIAQHVLDIVSLPVEIQGQSVSQTPSIGIASYPGCAGDIDSLVQCADSALYSAKKEGRNNYCFYSDKLSSVVSQYASNTRSLRHAIDAQQLEVYYQPQVDVSTGSIAGLEALVRWNHPENGLLPAAQFIPLAEHSGLITQLGAWVIERSCAQFSQWVEQGLIDDHSLTIGINISTNQFHQKNWITAISDVIDHNAIVAHQLELEISETAIIDDMDFCVDLLQKLASIGVSVAIDDYGTGYASFRHLERLPVQRLKIDRSFMSEVSDRKRKIGIMQSIITMAKALGINVVVEGVERRDQAQWLADSQCEVLQGHYFYSPMSTEKMQQVLQAQQLQS